MDLGIIGAVCFVCPADMEYRGVFQPCGDNKRAPVTKYKARSAGQRRKR